MARLKGRVALPPFAVMWCRMELAPADSPITVMLGVRERTWELTSLDLLRKGRYSSASTEVLQVDPVELRWQFLLRLVKLDLPTSQMHRARH